MGRPTFVFADRFVPVEFFDEDPIKLTLKISDEMDERLMSSAQILVEADKQPFAGRVSAYEKALVAIIGEEKADAILSRADTRDCFAVFEVINYLTDTYREAKAKKMTGSAR